MSSTRADKGYLYINGTKVNAEWDLELSKDYVDATVFGDPGNPYETFLTSLTNVKIDFDEPEVAFDEQAAREMYDEDPVALVIIDRLAKMEREVFFLREERDEARGHILSLQKKVLELQEYRKRVVQFEADDPVKNRKKSKKSRKTGR